MLFMDSHIFYQRCREMDKSLTSLCFLSLSFCLFVYVSPNLIRKKIKEVADNLLWALKILLKFSFNTLKTF